MDKLVIEYNSFQNKKIARALEKAVVAVLEQYHKRLFAYVGEADRINYDEIVDMLYNKLTERPDVDMCGPESAEALRQIGNLLDQQTYMDMEYRITAGFEENARNGFRYGVECLGGLMTGGRL